MMKTIPVIGDNFKFKNESAYQEFMYWQFRAEEVKKFKAMWSPDWIWTVVESDLMGVKLSCKTETITYLPHSRVEEWMEKVSVSPAAQWLEWAQGEIIRTRTKIMVMEAGLEQVSIPGVISICQGQIEEWKRYIIKREENIRDFKATMGKR